MSEKAYRCGWVALMGPPNAGKSTFLNKCLGQKIAIVSPKPQTTRNQITGILSDKEAQIIFMDTPGLHQAKNAVKGKMSRLLSQSAWQAMDDADVLIVMLDADLYARNPAYMDNDIGPLKEAIAHEERPVMVVLNKMDLLGDKSKILPLLEELHKLWPKAELFPASSLNGEGLEKLLATIKEKLPQNPAQFPEDQLSTLPMRFMAAEIIREKLYYNLRQELPYSTAVDIESWEEDPDSGSVTIHAVIYVSRSSHKGIVIGRAGQSLKKVGQSARMEIMDLLEARVHLQLFVKVKENWIEDMSFLHQLGLGVE